MTDNNKRIKIQNHSRYIDLGLKIQILRKKKKYTQEYLAELVDLSPNFITKIETPSKITSMSLETLFDIADALEVEPYTLLKKVE